MKTITYRGYTGKKGVELYASSGTLDHPEKYLKMVKRLQDQRKKVSADIVGYGLTKMDPENPEVWSYSTVGDYLAQFISGFLYASIVFTHTSDYEFYTIFFD